MLSLPRFELLSIYYCVKALSIMIWPCHDIGRRCSKLLFVGECIVLGKEVNDLSLLV